MRKYIKRQILEIIEVLAEAIGMVEQAIKSKRNFMNLLVEQQEAAQIIGEQIEAMEIDSTVVIGVLEEYCEKLWEMSCTHDVKQQYQLLKRLIQLLTTVNEEVNKFPEQMDVVFMPYKASMWDCMETVWKAAIEDPKCNAYVIPIPYYDKNQDGSFGELHYEGDLFPKDVQITSYKEYLLEQRHPEVIYIHNPFDEYNYVTSVMPDFYSHKIKQFTDMLVYIPYFNAEHHMPESQRFLSAYLHADKIILQNEEMIDDIDARIPREKLLAIGSPKTERLLQLQVHREQLLKTQIPEEWKAKIVGKKVVLYNTSLSGALKDREKQIDKMEEVLSTVSRYKDICLLWRPHPLMEITLATMCPDLLERYHKLQEWFVKNDLGILDTTPDVSISVVVADAYLGEDSSSIVDMFRVLDKPMFLIYDKNYYQPTEDELRADWTMDVCKVGDDYWFVALELQALCKYNLKNKSVEVVVDIPETAYSNYGIPEYVNIVSYENKIILVPYKATAVCVYDINTGLFQKHYFKDENVQQCFGRAVLFKHYVYMTPMEYPAIVRYDILTEKFEYFYQCVEEVLDRIEGKKKGIPFVWATASYENMLYLGSAISNQVISFDMETLSYSIDSVGDASNTYRGIATDADNCWLILCDSPTVVQWNRKTGEVTEHKEFPKDFVAGTVPFKVIIDMDKFLYLFPFHASRICKLEKTTGIISYAELDLPYEEGSHLSEFYEKINACYGFGKKVAETKVVLCSLYDDSLLELDVASGEYIKRVLRIADYPIRKLKKKYTNCRVLNETEACTISEFITYIDTDAFKYNRYKGCDLAYETVQSIGKEIYEIILGEI